jgi:hypothetical protein
LEHRTIAGGDALYQFLPLFQEAPTDWVDTAFGGYPAFADPQGLRQYPVARVMRVLGFSFNAFTIAGLVLAAWFAHLTLYALTRRHTAAVVAAVAYGTSSFFFAHLVHAPMIHAGAWVAAAVFCLVQWQRTSRRVWLLGLAVAVGLLVLAGAPQLAAYGVGWLGVLAVAMGLRERRLGTALWPVAAVVLGLGISAVQIVPTAELVGYTPRTALTRNDFLSNAFDAQFLPAAVVPRAYRSHRGSLEGQPDGSDLHVSIGLACLVLAALAVFHRAQRFWAIAFIGCAVVSLLLSLRPVASLFFSLPVYNLFRGPTRHHLFFALWLSLAGGLGAAALREHRAKLGTRHLLAMVGTVLVFLSPWLVSRPAAMPPRAWLFVLGWILALGAMRFSAHWALPVFALTLGIVEPWVNAYSMTWRKQAPLTASSKVSQRVHDLGKECRAEGCRVFPWNGYWTSSLPGNLSRLHDVPSLSGYNVLYLKRLGELLRMDPNGHVLDKKTLTQKGNVALDLLGVRYVLAQDDELSLLPESEGYTVDGKAGPDNVVRNAGAMPRAWFVSAHEQVTDATALSVVESGVLSSGTPFDPAAVALVEEATPEVKPSQALVTVTESRPGLLRVSVSPHHGGILVANDIWYPGWSATVAGASRQVLRVNAVQVGVLLNEGDAQVRLEFLPASKTRGRVVAMVSLLGALGLLYTRRRPVQA